MVQCLALCVVAVMVAASATTLGSAKCKPKGDAIKKNMPLFTACYEEATGKPFDKDAMRKEGGMTTKERTDMDVCVARKMGMFDANDQLDVDTAKQSFDDFEADDETKTKVEAAYEACKIPGGDAETVVECLHDAFNKNC